MAPPVGKTEPSLGIARPFISHSSFVGRRFIERRRVCEVDIAASAPHSQSSAHNIEGATIMAEAIVGAIITDIVGELVTGSIESGSDEATA